MYMTYILYVFNNNVHLYIVIDVVVEADNNHHILARIATSESQSVLYQNNTNIGGFGK